MSFRIEEKVVLTASDMARLQADLQGRGMVPLYPARLIRSVYFDTTGLQMFSDSEEGVLPRKKVRLRRYPEQTDAGAVLETKISSVEGRFKTTRPVDAGTEARLLRQGHFDRDYGTLMPMVAVSYRRSYYSLNGLRITFDRDISYARPDGQLAHRESWTVCELKAPAGAPLDALHHVLPVPRRRFSKFCNGISAVIARA
ncbi:polyphosphate polymerase domain-containing protein [Ruegeria pomeroyi]|nr:polyphosphate polymerase domain-containing protein [Ruegeria pomeroyi]MCE8533621.1 polyphosphate polymerase domain-containing protein [Ruegeria pomeroyi]